MPKSLTMLGFWSCAANFTWSIRLFTVSAFVERFGRTRRTVTIFSRPVGLSLAARYSVPRPEVSTSSRSTNFPNFSFLGMEGALTRLSRREPRGKYHALNSLSMCGSQAGRDRRRGSTESSARDRRTKRSAQQPALRGVQPYTQSRGPLHGVRVCANVKSWARCGLRVPPAAARLLLKEMAGGRNAGHGGSDDGTHRGRSRSGRGPAVPRGNPQRRLSQEPYVEVLTQRSGVGARTIVLPSGIFTRTPSSSSIPTTV